MERAALLSPTDVNVIRRYVQTKYAPLPGSRKAEIVAAAIRDALYRRLPELPEAVRDRLTDELIRRCLIKERREVRLEDVLDACADLKLLTEEAWASLLDWAGERLPGWGSADRLGDWLNRGQPSEAIRSGSSEGNAPQGAGDAGGRTAGSAERSAIAVLPAPSADVPSATAERPSFPLRRSAVGALSLLVLAGGIAIGVISGLGTESPSSVKTETAAPKPAAAASGQAQDAGMPEWLRYEAFDVEAVKAYLRSRDSLLADEPYFGAIVESARTYDVHPLLLFAITGQEQGFVPKSHEQAEKIANNPFNVFHSWQEYNTNIADSSAIAAKLIAKLGQSRPEGYDPFEWFNRTYAEDPQWSDGVRKLFEKLKGQ